MKIRIDHLDANPFRHIERYPIREQKIATLVESIGKTGFWDNMVGRQVGDRIQIAYGHHRREALRRAFGPDHEIGIVVRDFSDEDMLQIMARENLEEWGSSASIELETVRAVVEAYGAGQVELTAPGPFARNVRQAPGFVMGSAPAAGRSPRPYSSVNVAEFLGWNEDKVGTALSALELIEKGYRTDADFVEVGTKAARAMVEETRRLIKVQEEAERRAAEQAAKVEQARQEAAAAADKAAAEREDALRKAAEAKQSAQRAQASRAAEEATDRAEAAERHRRETDAIRQAQVKAQAQREKAREAEREQHTRAMKDHLSSGGGYKNLREAASKVYDQPKDSPPPDINVYATRLAAQIHKMFDPELDSDRVGNLNELIKHREHLRPAAVQELARELSALSARVSALRERLTHTQTTGDMPEGDELDVIDAELVDDNDETKENH